MAQNWGRAKARGRGPAGRKGPGAAGTQARPGWLGEGVQAGKEEVVLSPPGRENPKSERAAESGGPAAWPIPVPARLPGSWPSAAPPPRSPHLGSPNQRRRGVARRQSPAEPEPTPQQAGAGRPQGQPSRAGRPPASPPRDSRLSCPAPAALVPPRGLARRPRPGGSPLRCGAARLSGPLPVPGGRSQQVCPSVPRRRSKCALPPPCGCSTPHTVPPSGPAPGAFSALVEMRFGDGTCGCPLPRRAVSHTGPVLASVCRWKA